jgi:hypothetical protein
VGVNLVRSGRSLKLKLVKAISCTFLRQIEELGVQDSKSASEIEVKKMICQHW